MRWIVGGKAAQGGAASASQMGRFETRWLTAAKNLSALTDPSGQWVDHVYGRRMFRGIVLDMHSSVSPTHGEQEKSVCNGHFECTCYHPLFVFNQFGDLERCALRTGNVHSADGWKAVLDPVVERYHGKVSHLRLRADAAFANPDVYENLEERRITHAIRLPANRILQDRISYLLKRPVGRPPHHVRRHYANLRYRAASWETSRRVVAKVEWHPGELYPRVGFIVTNMSRPAEPSSPSTAIAAHASSGSRKARTPSSGRGCHAGRSTLTPRGSSFMHWPTISATSCARWRRPSRSGAGR